MQTLEQLIRGGTSMSFSGPGMVMVNVAYSARFMSYQVFRLGIVRPDYARCFDTLQEALDDAARYLGDKNNALN